MTYNYNISYMPCRDCHAKIKCGICSEEIMSSLKNLISINSIEVDMFQKIMNIDVPDSVSEDDILDNMEDIGVFEG